jgi:DNA-binding NarL/FixJ family response regulator
MRSAFTVLIDSAPNLSLLASADNLDELRTMLGEKRPDVILVYLVKEDGIGNGNEVFETLTRIKNPWPEVLCVTIVKYTSQMEKVKEFGADLVLVDGVNAEKLLAAIEGKYS